MQGANAAWQSWGNFIGPGTGPATSDDLTYRLRFCPAPTHQVGSFREQYNGQTYCYKCTRLDCENRSINLESVDRSQELDCYTSGNVVEADP